MKERQNLKDIKFILELANQEYKGNIAELNKQYNILYRGA